MTTFYNHPPGFGFNNHEESMPTLGGLSPNYHNNQSFIATRRTSRAGSNASYIPFESESTHSPMSYRHSPGSFIEDEHDGHSMHGTASSTSMMTPAEHDERDRDLPQLPDLEIPHSRFHLQPQQQLSQGDDTHQLVTPDSNFFNNELLAPINGPPVPVMQREQSWSISPQAYSQYHLTSPQFSQNMLSVGYLNQSALQEPWSQLHPRNSRPSPQSAVLWAPDSDPNLQFNLNRAHQNQVSQFSPNTNYHFQAAQHPMMSNRSPPDMSFSQRTRPLGTAANSPYQNEHTPTHLETVPYQHHIIMPDSSPAFEQYHEYPGSEHSPMSSQSEFESVTMTQSEFQHDFHLYDDQHMAVSGAPNPASPTVIDFKAKIGREKNRKHNKSNRVVKASGSGQAAARGGRQLGSHMHPEKAAEINEMRKLGVCWGCKIQRDKCDQGENCERCSKRSTRLGKIIECTRDPLRDLVQVYIPPCMNNLHNPETLRVMTDKAVREWHKKEIMVSFSVGDGLPSVRTGVYQFDPKGQDNSILRQYQHMTDKQGNDSARTIHCPPLGLMGVHRYEKGAYYDEWVRLVIADKGYRAAFIRKASGMEKDDYLKRLLNIFFNVHTSENTPEARDLDNMRYLCVVAYVIAHSFCIELDEKDSTVAKMVGYEHITYPKYTCARLANRQLKIIFCQILSNKLDLILHSLQQTFTHSKIGDNWSTSFVILLGAGIVLETLQTYVHHSNIALEKEGDITKYQAECNSVSQVATIDDKFGYTVDLFWRKYNKYQRENPLNDPYRDWSLEAHPIKIEGISQLLQHLNPFVLEKKSFLENRIAFKPNHKLFRDYSGRLTGVFLLSFFPA